jgi:hypothetical protein
MSAPHKHDLEVSSHVNSEVKVFIRTVQKKTENFNHAVMEDMVLSREHFSRHGLHMNSSGKDFKKEYQMLSKQSS